VIFVIDKNNIVAFPMKNRQADNHLPHTINRGDAIMPVKEKWKQTAPPIVKVELLNYSSSRQDEYSTKFMSPLITGLLKRFQLAQAK
jgi:hypothetical protein